MANPVAILPKQRVIVYVDGFNFYFGLKNNNWKKFYWLDIVRFCEQFIKPNQELKLVKYFSARSLNPSQHDRQDSFFCANKENPKFKLILGKFQLKDVNCNKCSKTFKMPEEKQSDVNVAVQMIKDVINDACDISILISADSDLVPPLNYMHEIKHSHKIFVFFPPKHRNYSLQNVCDSHIYLQQAESKFAKALLPDEVILSSGIIIKKPERWKPIIPPSSPVIPAAA